MKMEHKSSTDRRMIFRQLCIQSHNHSNDYQVYLYTWSVPYTRRYISHTRLRLHNRNVD